MALEDILTRIAVALEKQAGIDPEKRGPGRPPKASTPVKVEDAPAAAPVAAPAPAPEPPVVEAKTYTAEDVRAALVAFQKRATPEAARTLLKEVGGADTLKALKAEKYGAVVAAAESA